MPVKLSNKILLLATVLLTFFSLFKYSKYKTTFQGDAIGYYQYLPSLFIYHNLTSYAPLPKNKGISKDALYYNSLNKDEKGTIVINQYTYGIAFMESPFFIAAHLLELWRGGYANGYSATYDKMIKLGMLFYAFLGLAFVYKILTRYFNETLSTIGVIAIYIGTNLFWFTAFQPGMSHVPLFFLYSLLMLLVIQAHDKPRRVFFIGTGLVIGMITIIRPTDIICITIPLLYNAYSRNTIKAKLLFIKQNTSNIFYLALAAVIPILPQFIYWKILTGNFLYYSYRNQTFDWAHPKIIEGLFYFSNGWLPYSPLMIFALFGLVFYKRIKPWAWCCWLLLPTYIYIIYSWYCYRYINGLGSRPMIHMYPLLAIPLTAFIQFASQRKLWIRLTLSIIAFFFVALNLSNSYQQAIGILWSEESNLAYNTQMMFRTKLRYEDAVVHDIGEIQPDTSKTTKICTLAIEHYNDSISEHTQPDPNTGGKYVYHMYNQEYQETNLVGKYSSIAHKGAKWIKCSGRFMCKKIPAYYRHMLVLTVQNKLWRSCKIENKLCDWDQATGSQTLTLFDFRLHTWGQIYYFVKVPDNIADGDEIKLFSWSIDKTDLFIDDLSLELYK